MFFTALLTIPKMWCPSTNELIKNVLYTCNGILFNFKKKGKPTICENMDGKYIKWNKKSQKEKYYVI